MGVGYAYRYKGPGQEQKSDDGDDVHGRRLELGLIGNDLHLVGGFTSRLLKSLGDVELAMLKNSIVLSCKEPSLLAGVMPTSV